MYESTLGRRNVGISTNSVFARTMMYVAATSGLFALGAYVGRRMAYGEGFITFIGAFVCLIAMRFTVGRSRDATVTLLAAFGLLMGAAMAPTLAYYASADPQALWQAGIDAAVKQRRWRGRQFAARRVADRGRGQHSAQSA